MHDEVVLVAADEDVAERLRISLYRDAVRPGDFPRHVAEVGFFETVALGNLSE